MHVRENVHFLVMELGILPWDGSYLGAFPQECVLREEETEVGRRALLHIGYRGYYCILYRVQSRGQAIFRCMVDEMKVPFGLPKSGTHRMKIGDHLYFVRRLEMDVWGLPIPENKLSKFSRIIPPETVTLIRRLLLFRDILSLSSTIEANIVVWYDEGRLCVQSVNEISTTFQRLGRDVGILGNNLVHRWFPNGEDITVSMMFLKEPEAPLCQNLEYIRTELHSIVYRLDKEWIWYPTFILDRLTRYVSSEH